MLTPAVQAHHKAKALDHPEQLHNWDNLTPLCAACHNVRTRRGE